MSLPSSVTNIYVPCVSVLIPAGRWTLRSLLYPETPPRRCQQNEASLRDVACQQGCPGEPVRGQPELQRVHRGMCPPARPLSSTWPHLNCRYLRRPRGMSPSNLILLFRERRFTICLSCVSLRPSVELLKMALGWFCWLHFCLEPSVDSRARDVLWWVSPVRHSPPSAW